MRNSIPHGTAKEWLSDIAALFAAAAFVIAALTFAVALGVAQ